MQLKFRFLCVLFTSFITFPAVAQDYPNRPITLVVPSAAGGANDLAGRVIADHMSRTLGQSFIIENKGGAGGSIATRQVAQAAPDGYTLVIGGTGTLSVHPTLHPDVGYETARDFSPVGMIATSALVLVAHPSLAAKSVPELIALAKAAPGKISFASSGIGSGIHLSGELFSTMAGVKMTHVPYRGSTPALNDVVGGHVELYFSAMPPAVGLVRDGKVRALAVTGLARASVLPDVPTVSEAALPGYEAVLHFGLVAPAGTPQPIIDKLNASMRTALADKTVQDRLASAGADPAPGSPQDYAAYLDRESRKWADVIKTSGIKAN